MRELKDRQVIVVIHRFGGLIFGNYMNYNTVIDHSQNDVIYFVNENGYKDIAAYKEQAAKIVRFERLEQQDELDQAMFEVVSTYGPIDHLISLSEFDMDVAAFLRTKYAIPGVDEQQVQLYRNKVEMKKRLKEHSIRTPYFIDFTTSDEVLAFAKKVNYPLILKPKVSAASIGVKLVHTDAELEEFLTTISLADYEAEEFVEGTIFHIDGIVNKGKIEFISVSRYVGSCLDFSKGKPCGSILITKDKNLRQRIVDFTGRSLKALELSEGSFHMELIHKQEKELVFLEIGARFGGAEIPFFLLDRFGIHLGEETVKILLGTFTGVPEADLNIHGGFLQIPEPQNTPLEVIHVTSLKEQIPEIFSEVIPNAGDIMDGSGSYYHISGRFMFDGQSEDQVEQAILKSIQLFHLEGKPLEKIKI
ncbi:ATP-grasp domain-containing protein [Paenibacillus jamilae]|uniref:ATP-grasp domain-containing protein n=1 Tax=Paenibacillus jamilae TaxID=114136 RepID=UPI0018D276D9|nr:ATP-grasp domain-containing protein [Paenibacillus jamilae]